MKVTTLLGTQLFVAALLCASPAVALTCTFPTDCLEGLACKTLSEDLHTTVSVDTETFKINQAPKIPVVYSGTNDVGAVTYIAVGDDDTHMLTVQNGVARYATHYSGRDMFYQQAIGTCSDEGAQNG